MTPRHGLSRVVALTLLVGVACQDGDAPTDVQAPVLLGEVVGVVTADGAPAPGVGVELTGGTVGTAFTGSSGEYRFSGVPLGAYVVALVQVPEDLRFMANPAKPLVISDAETHPMVLVRDAVTGEVLSFARGGDARVRPTSDRIQLVFSNGVGSSAPQIRVWR